LISWLLSQVMVMRLHYPVNMSLLARFVNLSGMCTLCPGFHSPDESAQPLKRVKSGRRNFGDSLGAAPSPCPGIWRSWSSGNNSHIAHWTHHRLQTGPDPGVVMPGIGDRVADAWERSAWRLCRGEDSPILPKFWIKQPLFC